MTKPFIKWAGGKTQLLEQLKAKMPATYGRYFEPMVGGGALFFNISPANATICDLNAEAINTYNMVRSAPEELIAHLTQQPVSKEYYYYLRNLDRNETTLNAMSNIERASRFFYLNKTCFNGLYRVNRKGQFNVPIGSVRTELRLDTENIRACSRALQNTTILQGDYTIIGDQVAAGDFVYFDPPYLPINETSNFTQYTKAEFGKEQHLQLRDFCRTLSNRGVHFMLSNSHCDYTIELFAEFNTTIVPARRVINSKGSRRGPVNEILITNY